MSAADKIANAIYDLVKAHGNGVTFATVAREVAAFNGPLDYVDHDDPNVLLWRGVSAPAVTALRNLLAGGGIHFRRASVEKYNINGKALPMPTRPREPGGRSWRPVAFFLGPAPIAMEATERRMRR